jgi:hypothetical protein
VLRPIRIDRQRPSLLGADERCERGDIDACLLRAKETEVRDRVHALRLYMRGCEHAGDATTRPAGARACSEAARLCAALGFGTRAEDYQKRARALLEPSPPAP